MIRNQLHCRLFATLAVVSLCSATAAHATTSNWKFTLGPEANGATGLKVSGIGTPRVVTAYAFIRMGAHRIGSNAAPEIVDSLPDVQRELFPTLDPTSPTD